MEIFAKRIRELRTERGLNQETVANAVGIAQRTYSGYECGESEPAQKILVELAKFFGVSVDYLLGEEDYVQPK